ncbi:MFS transporter [Niveibacterium umoris]|uniref:Fucose permease n=1 Tax=Niveibacterium umoris TaxID=1193620 RepID=A0A840BHF3_9RHOO|nr:MFS transporter [Niveibacterium umoris]MBB4011032.1 fucose permease [Niveibacterium umoris]
MSKPSPIAARIATKAHFFVSGLLFATWGVHVPTVKAHYGLSESALAGLMLASGIGALIALTRVGHWVARHGARPVVMLGGLTVALPLTLLLGMPGYAAMLALMFAFGLATGAFDVAMNAEAVAVEHAYARPIMSSFHGFFSLGGMVGAGIGSLVATAGIAASTHLLVAGVGGGGTILLASRWMLPDEATHSPDDAGGGFSLPPRPVLLLGLLAALGLLGEGAMYDWSALYMVKELGSPQAQAALAYGAFSAAMASARFGGDWVRAHVGPAKLLRLSSWLAAAAMTAALLIGTPWAALVGFALVGIGFSNIVPVLFAAAARIPGITPARGIAGVSSCGYLGFMIGPPVIGAIAQHRGLDVGLFVVAVFAALVALLAGKALGNTERPATRP